MGLVVVFWSCVALVTYAYIGYPVLIWALARGFGRHNVPPLRSPGNEPRASLILAAYNEEAVIGDRLRNALNADYPSDRIEILVGSDGSTDRTAEIVRGFDDPRIRFHDYRENRGKASVLNELASEASGEILLMSDANTDVDPEAAGRLVRWFVDPKVGAVVGRLVLIDPVSGRNADGVYWKYETFLKKCEGRLGALLGANGAIYAIRKRLYEPIPPDTIVDDFVIPLLAKLRTGCTIVYDPEAFATEETAPAVGDEFHRRSRIGAGGFQSIVMLRRLLNPLRGWVAFTFFSHKILRWLGPFFLIGALAANAALAGRPFYRAFLMAQVAFYLGSIAMAFVPAGVGWLKPLRITTMFVSMNAALLVGFWRWASGRQRGTWRRTARAGEAGEGAR